MSNGAVDSMSSPRVAPEFPVAQMLDGYDCNIPRQALIVASGVQQLSLVSVLLAALYARSKTLPEAEQARLDYDLDELYSHLCSTTLPYHDEHFNLGLTGDDNKVLHHVVARLNNNFLPSSYQEDSDIKRNYEFFCDLVSSHCMQSEEQGRGSAHALNQIWQGLQNLQVLTCELDTEHDDPGQVLDSLEFGTSDALGGMNMFGGNKTPSSPAEMMEMFAQRHMIQIRNDLLFRASPTKQLYLYEYYWLELLACLDFERNKGRWEKFLQNYCHNFLKQHENELEFPYEQGCFQDHYLLFQTVLAVWLNRYEATDMAVEALLSDILVAAGDYMAEHGASDMEESAN